MERKSSLRSTTTSQDDRAPEPPAKKAKKASAASDDDPNKPTTDKYKVVVKNLADGKIKEQPVADPTFAQMKEALKAKSVKHDWPPQQLEGKCSDANITFVLNEAGKAKFKVCLASPLHEASLPDLTLTSSPPLHKD